MATIKALLQKMTPEDRRNFEYLKAGVAIARQRAAAQKSARIAMKLRELEAIERGAKK